MDESKNQTGLLPTSEMNIRRKCLEWTLEIVKGEGGMSKADFGFCGMQDLKCQIVDCAKALSDFLIEGKTTDSIVGLTPFLLSASRALRDRGITLSVLAFDELMKSKGLMAGVPANPTLTKAGQEYGRMKPSLPGCANAYYYDNKFDELLLLLGITEDKENVKSTVPPKKSKK